MRRWSACRSPWSGKQKRAAAEYDVPLGNGAAGREQPVTESDEYILGNIRNMVWSGFYTPEDVDQTIDETLEDDADGAFLRAAVLPEFAKKAAAEATWSEITDCDRLNEAFRQLNAQGIVAMQNAGYTMSDGRHDVLALAKERGQSHVRGYCFYHGQDLERAVDGMGLWLAFGSLNDDAAAKAAVGRSIAEVLTGHGFDVDWNGDPETRLSLPRIEWKRRGPGARL